MSQATEGAIRVLKGRLETTVETTRTQTVRLTGDDIAALVLNALGVVVSDDTQAKVVVEVESRTGYAIPEVTINQANKLRVTFTQQSHHGPDA